MLESLFNKVAACNLIKKEALAQEFSGNFAKFLRTRFLTEHLRGLLLVIEAAHIWNDIVLRKFQYPTVEENCKYHISNARYKSYTIKKTLDATMVMQYNFLYTLFCMFLFIFLFIY